MPVTDLCIHDIFPEWCFECKHENKGTVKSVLKIENLKIAENLLSWETNHTTLR